MDMNSLCKKAKRPLPNGHFSSRVLVVDDEAMIREEITEFLVDGGFACDRASHGRSALEMILNDPSISVVVTDLKMQGMDGLELIRKINSSIPAYRDLALIVVTGHAGTAEAIEALRLGAMDFLIKPIDPDHLVHAVRRADETLKLRRLERHFQEQLKTEVRERTAEVRKLASDLEEANVALTKRNRELAVANQVKGDFLALISHELRTPLNAIIGFSEVMGQELYGPLGHTTYREYADDIRTSGTHLLNIINEILDVSKTEAGMIRLADDSVDLAEIIETSVRLLKPRALEKGIEIEIDLPATVTRVRGDRQRLKQVLLNLLSNAVKFTNQGSITVRLRCDPEDGVLLRIIDTGIGIPEGDLQRIMEPFTQVDSTLTRAHEGTGLGLPLSRVLVEAHDGRLTIESVFGEGSTATMHLPASRLLSAADAA